MSLSLSKVFDIHIIMAASVFFILGFFVFPRINHKMVAIVNRDIWLGIVAPVIGISCVIIGVSLVSIARGVSDEVVLEFLINCIFLFVISLLGYAWHIISPDSPDKDVVEIERNIKKTREAINQIVDLGEYSKEAYLRIQGVLNGKD